MYWVKQPRPIQSRFGANLMSKVKSFLMVAVAVTGATLASSCLGQGCSTGQCGTAQYASAGCSSCATGTAGQAFGFPAQASGSVYQSAFSGGGCGHGGCGGRARGQFVNEMKARCDHARMIHDRTMARNGAWPKPFDCADRQLYFSVWEPMIDQGFEEQCVLTSAHFDPATNELNKFGQHAVAGIMQNMPSTRRTVFLNRDTNPEVSEARRKAVADTINTFYGQQGPASIAYSQKRPVTTHGLKAALIQEQLLGNMPTPAIPVSVGQDVNSAVGGN